MRQTAEGYLQNSKQNAQQHSDTQSLKTLWEMIALYTSEIENKNTWFIHSTTSTYVYHIWTK